jgi:Fe-S-cluster containining protein
MKPCNFCGKCCKFGEGAGLGSATRNDIIKWRKYRPDILNYSPPPSHDLWVSPVTGEETYRCPWLRKLPMKASFICRIHEFRPEVCHHYPVNIEQMISDQCEMLEPGDAEKSANELKAELSKLRNVATR